MVIVINTVIGGFSLSGPNMIASTVRLQECDYSWKEWLVKNKAANTLLVFEETVMGIRISGLNQKWRNAPFLLQRLLHKKNEAERIPIIEQIKQMDCIVIILMNWSQIIDNAKHCLQNRITSRPFYGGSIQRNNFQWTKLSV